MNILNLLEKKSVQHKNQVNKMKNLTNSKQRFKEQIMILKIRKTKIRQRKIKPTKIRQRKKSLKNRKVTNGLS